MSENDELTNKIFLSHQRHQLYVAVVILAASLLLTPAAPGGECVSFLGLKIPVLCPHRLLLKSQCPGCGLIRSFTAIAHGQFAESLKFHRLGVALFLFVTAQIPLRIYLMLKGPKGIPHTIDVLIYCSAPMLAALLIVSWLGSQFAWF